MKTKNLVPALILSSAGLVPAASMAEVSANIGWVSEYIYRGIHQDDSSAYAGIDYASDGGFYLGTWGADVGDGIETDLYFGYAGGEDFTYKIGYTGYYYTDDFDDTYNEVNLGIGYGIFALDVAIGEWDGFGSPADYTFTSITLAPEKGPYYKFGSFGDDFDGRLPRARLHLQHGRRRHRPVDRRSFQRRPARQRFARRRFRRRVGRVGVDVRHQEDNRDRSINLNHEHNNEA